MEHELGRRLDSQLPTTPHRTNSPVRLPDLEQLASRTAYIPIRNLRDEIEHTLIVQGSEQLDVLGLRPHQWHGGACRASQVHTDLRAVRPIPYLFREQTIRPGKVLHRCNKSPYVAASGQFIMTTFAR